MKVKAMKPFKAWIVRSGSNSFRQIPANSVAIYKRYRLTVRRVMIKESK